MPDRVTADAGSADDAASPSVVNDVIETVLPDAADTDRRRRNRKILIRVGWAVVSSLVLFLLTKGIDLLTSEHDARVTSEADDKVDRKGPAFSASVRQDTENAEASLYDAPFSDQEKQQILGPPRGLRPFSETHHGRRVFYSDIWRLATPSQWWGYSEAWLADLVSDRQAALVINSMRMKGVRCTPAKANTVTITHGEGQGSYDGMLFDVTRSTSVPLITGNDEDLYGEPYFAHKKIDLGNGATPGGLRIQVTSGTKDCTWKAFEVTYVDSAGTHTQDITNNGKDFTVHGISEHPEQVYEFNVDGVLECTPLQRGRYECPGW